VTPAGVECRDARDSGGYRTCRHPATDSRYVNGIASTIRVPPSGDDRFNVA